MKHRKLFLSVSLAPKTQCVTKNMKSAAAATYDEDGNELTAAVEAVMGTRSVPDMQGIDQSKLVPLLTAALQEALTEISALKARVTALENA
jgi:hypothetical protein